MDGGISQGGLTVEQTALRAGHDGGRTKRRWAVGMRVERQAGGHRLAGDWADVAAANDFLGHLEARAFAPATVRAYAYDLLNFARFATERRLALADVIPTDVFDWIDWQRPPRRRTGTVVAFGARAGAAPASVNRRVAALRAFLEHRVLAGARASNPVPAPRRGAGLRPKARGPLGHLGPGRTRFWRPARPRGPPAPRVARPG